MEQERLLYLIGRKQSGELTLQEQLELSGLLQSEEGKFLADAMEELFASQLSYQPDLPAAATNRALEKLHAQLAAPAPPVRKGRFRQLRYWAAAAILLLIGLGIVWQSRTPAADSRSSNIVRTKKGSKTDLVLPDGTRVWVNADTRLVYDKDFGVHTRELQLTGEAYFDVTKDEQRPFIVHTANMDVKVLGTAFNVRAYANETSTQTTLLRGSVEIQLKGKDHKTIRLSPNEKIILHRQPATEETGSPAPENRPDIELLKIPEPAPHTLSSEIQWTNDQLVFEQESFDNIIPVLERWYNVKIEKKGSVQSDRLLNVKFENDSLEDVLRALQAVVGFQYRIQKDTIIIY